MRTTFYQRIMAALIAATILAAIGLMASCEIVPAIAPDDWAWHPPTPPDTTDTDTIVLPPDTCTELIEITEPAFVTLYLLVDNEQDSILWEGGNVQSYDLGDVASAITTLPFEAYQTNQAGTIVIHGTNNASQFSLKVFARADGAKWYFGYGSQAFIFPALTASEYKGYSVSLPSVDQFTFWGNDYTEAEATPVKRNILGDCKLGRSYADLHFGPPTPQGLIDSFDLFQWDRIRLAPAGYSYDFRGMVVPDVVLQNAATSGKQLVFDDYCDNNL